MTPGYLACSGFDSMSVVWSFSFLLSQCHPQWLWKPSWLFFPPRYTAAGIEAPPGLLFCKVPLTLRQGNEVNPGVLLLCTNWKPWHPGPSLYYTSPPLRPSLDLPTSTWHSQGLDLARKWSFVQGRDWEILISPVLSLNFLCHEHWSFPCG